MAQVALIETKPSSTNFDKYFEFEFDRFALCSDSSVKKVLKKDVDLEIDTEYYAVITTYDPKVAGDGWMMITGPGAVSIDIIPEPSAYPIAIGFLAFLYIAIKNRNKV